MFSGGFAVKRRSPSELGAMGAAAFGGCHHTHAAPPSVAMLITASAFQRRAGLGLRVSLSRASRSSPPFANRRARSAYRQRWMMRFKAGLARADETRSPRAGRLDI